MTYLFHVDPRDVADEGSELDIQKRLIGRLRKVAPAICVVAIPNAGKRSAWEAMKAKQEGMRGGFPDLEAIWSGGHAYLEMKTKTGALAPAQVEWLNWLQANGHPAGVFRSVDSAVAFLRNVGAPVLQQVAA